MPDKSKVSTGKAAVAGAVFYAPAGTTVPTTASGSLDAAFKDLGYISDEGLVNSLNKAADQTRAWGGDIVNVEVSEPTDEFKFTLIQSLSSEVLKFIYDASNVTAAGSSISVNVNHTAPAGYAFVFDMVMKGGVAKRIVVPEAYLSSLDDITYVDGEVTGYACTITATADSSGNTHYEYIEE